MQQQFNKNEGARLRKVAAQLDVALDALHRAQGELYIPALKEFADDIAELIQRASEIQRALPTRQQP